MFNAMQALQSFGLAQQMAERQAEMKRRNEARSALSDYLVSRPLQRGSAHSSAPTSIGHNPPDLRSPVVEQPPSSPVQGLLSAGASALGAGEQAPMQAPQESMTARLLAAGQGTATQPPQADYDAQVVQAPPAGQMAAQVPARSPQDEAFERLARIDPETAYKVQKLDAQQRAEMAESFGKQMDVSGRVMSAVLSLPVDQQAAAYQRYLPQLKAQGVFHLPEQWDPVQAKADMRTGMTVLQAVGADRQDRRAAWDLEDDLLDNERDDRNTDSLIGTREEQLQNTRRGQDLSHERGLRGQDLANSRGIRGQDLTNERTIRGQDLTDSRTRRGQDLTDTRTRRGQDMTDRRTRDSASFRGVGGKRGGAGAAPARIVNPQTGQAMVLQNGKWVPER